ncbi:hypothetical protein UPYG_G00050520 [Umbra pygmaea]|uniref:Uncharacterized protein n=1 Tax=Umbra pygmaea TaxID=75934 RepID=A0ABD0XTV1_UMBPY
MDQLNKALQWPAAFQTSERDSLLNSERQNQGKHLLNVYGPENWADRDDPGMGNNTNTCSPGPNTRLTAFLS